MSKKILAVALAAAMILGLASVAFAASFSDTVGHEREAAIKQLAGLGLLNGYPDGTFRPENPITRAEFAKVMVYALGLKDAAEMLAGVPVSFTDVEPNHWAVGYISIAASQEIVKGYPDGTFGPQNNVTYAEVITMILRALGYGPVLDKQPWPMAYLTKATELKINKGVNFVSNAPATRGDVAALIANALTTPKLVPVEYGADGQPTRYAESGSKEELPLKTLLHNLGAEFITGWLEDSPELWSNKGGIVIEEPRDKDGALLVQAPDTSKKYELAEGTEVAGLLGHKVRAWVNEDGEVFFLEDITPASAVKSASYSASRKVKVDGKEVSIADATIFRNYVVADSVKSGDTITVIYSGNTPKYVVAVGYDWGVVRSVNLTYSRVSFKDKSGEVGALILDDNYEVVWDGAANSLDDVEENDVFDFIYDSTNKKAIIIVTRDSVIGKFTKLTGSAATIDGVDYSYKNAPTSFLGKTVIAVFNKDGKIVYMTEMKDAPSAANYGVVYAKAEGATDEWGKTIQKLKLVDQTGASRTLSAAVSDDTYDDIELGDVITFTLNSDGVINSINSIKKLEDTWNPSLEIDKDRLLVGGKRLATNAVVFDISALVAELEKSKPAPAASMIKVVKPSVVFDFAPALADADIIADDAGRVVLVVSKKELVPATSTGLGMYYGSYRTVVGNTRYWVLRILENGVITDYVVKADDLNVDAELSAPANYGKSLSKTVLSFVANADNEIEARPEPEVPVRKEQEKVGDTVYWELRITEIDLENGVITVQQFEPSGKEIEGSVEYFWVDKNTLYYDVSGSNPVSLMSLEEVSVWSKVSIYGDDETGEIDVLVIH